MKLSAPLLLGFLVLLLQVGSFFSPTPAVRLVFVLGSLVTVGFLVAWALRSSSAEAASISESVTSPPEVPRPEAELVAFLALLQEHGRLVDFVREDLAGASDAEVGAAARVVHAGCRRVLEDSFTIEPVRQEAEGTSIELSVGYDAPAHRLVGKVADEPPYRGKLLHPGWRATAIRLPKVTGTTSARPWPVLAPAEVEIS